MDINNLTLEAIKNYHKVLKKTGTINGNQIHSLLILTLLNKLCSAEYSQYITEKDYVLISDTVRCISKNACIIDYRGDSSYIGTINIFNTGNRNSTYTSTDPIKNYIEDIPIRIDEEDIIRLSHDDVLRFKNNLN